MVLGGLGCPGCVRAVAAAITKVVLVRAASLCPLEPPEAGVRRFDGFRSAQTKTSVGEGLLTATAVDFRSFMSECRERARVRQQAARRFPQVSQDKR
jgi:hypothetical protein